MIFSENAARAKHTSTSKPATAYDLSTTCSQALMNKGFWQQIGGVIEPERIALLQLGSFLALALSWQLPTPSLANDQTLTAPVVGSQVVNHYRQSETQYLSGHRGVDYAVEFGQGVFAPNQGQVHFVGKVVDRRVLSIAHDNGLLTAFEPVCSSLAVGEEVLQGDLIGEVCEGDQNYQPHCQEITCLHFSVRKDAEYLSPLWFTGELSPSRLLPWIEPGH